MRYYVDLRTMELEDEVTLNVDFLAPELYYEFGENYGNFYKETWYVGNGVARIEIQERLRACIWSVTA